MAKTYKPELAMCPILSATGTYNFTLAKWLDEKLKPMSINEFTKFDPLRFSEELRKNENIAVNTAEKNQLFQLDGRLYEQIGGVADR